MQVFFTIFCVVSDYSNSIQKAKQSIENLTAKSQTSNQKSYPEQLGPGAPFLGLAKSLRASA